VQKNARENLVKPQGAELLITAVFEPATLRYGMLHGIDVAGLVTSPGAIIQACLIDEPFSHPAAL